jgi:hypothetical protein
MFVDRGVGAQLHYERADGNLKWQRIEARLAARRELGPFQLYARGDAGILPGTPVPQAIFEIGSEQGLSSYGYKEFAGDRAAILRTVLGYTFPVLRAPIRLPGQFIFPGLAPGVAAGVHGAWTEISSAEARAAVLRLGVTPGDGDGMDVPFSRATDGVRASAEFLATLFSGALAFGVTRSIDHPDKWAFTWRIGQGF